MPNIVNRTGLQAKLLLTFCALIASACFTVRAPQNAGIPAVKKTAVLPLNAPDESLKEAEQLSLHKDYEAVQKLLVPYQATNPRAKLWQRWLLGQALMERGALEPGFELLEANYRDLRDASAGWDADAYRVAARSLKKIGWYYRQKKEFERAYTYHHLQYLYLARFGSPDEIHDALISLDFDSYELQQAYASEHWLREALRVGETIEEDLPRTKALATTWNNLSDTLRIQKRWTEAAQAGLESQNLWRVWDASNGAKDRRELWALIQTASIYGDWATSLDDPTEATNQFNQAHELARTASLLAAKLQLDVAEQAEIDSRLKIYQAPLQKPSADVPK